MMNETTLFIIGGLAVALIFYGIMIYNNLVTLKNSVSKSWANIEVLLKQRNSELPKLVETCKQYMQYEETTLNDIVEARNQAMRASDAQDMTGLGLAETAIRSGLGKLFALAENYPDLKANETFLHLQSRVSELENSISDRREFYNESVNLNNTRIEQFPDVIIAGMFNFKAFDLLKFSDDELKDHNVKDLFNS